MRHLVEKNGYIYCGHCYYYEDVETDDGIVQDFERIAFCKVLKKQNRTDFALCGFVKTN